MILVRAAVPDPETSVQTARIVPDWPELVEREIPMRRSHDETRVAVENVNTVGGTMTSQIWIIDLETGIQRQLTLDGTLNQFPVWTADGDAILFASDREDRPAIYRKSADGIGGTGRIWEADPGERVIPSSVSVDGVLAFTATSGGSSDIWTIPLDEGGSGGSAEATKIIEMARVPAFSPDGTAIAYLVGTGETLIRPYPIADDTVQRVPVGLAAPPAWYREGGELVYSDVGTGEVRSTRITTRPRLTLGSSSELFPIGSIDISLPGTGGVFVPWDTVSGRRLIIAHNVATPASDETSVANPQINVVLNWFQELRERAPVP